MRAIFALVAALALPCAASASEPVRVQNRLLQKDGRLFVNAGPTFLDRADYFSNPGVLASLSWYVRESDGLELRLAWFFSGLSPSGREIVERTHLVPDAHRPIALALVGWRRSVGYGKVLVGSRVVHFDLHLAAHAGATHTERQLSAGEDGGGPRVERTFSPALGAAPGVVARVGDRFHAQLDLGALLSLEQRAKTTLALGFLPSLTVGMSL